MNELQDLERRHPEWTPWLAVLRAVLDELRDAGWDATVPQEPAPRQRNAPLLAGIALRPDGRVGRLFEKVMQSAVRSGAPKMAGLRAVAHTDSMAHAVFRDALNGDDAGLGQLATDAGADAEALGAVAALVPMPFLHACRRRWEGAMPPGWAEGYCPCCGAWPAFAEVRGIERSRHLRCGRCGSAWQLACLTCPYCGMTDHEQLASLVPEKGGSTAAIEVCSRCRGYVKAFTTLQGSPPAQVMLDDLASVELDLAAAARDYRRPPGVGYTLDVTLTQESLT
jgi:FdhE protein